MEKLNLFWDVDTQYDFMLPEGRLYVPEAETLIPLIGKIRQFV
jgi:nicotinamidase/pyrazinamidase